MSEVTMIYGIRGGPKWGPKDEGLVWRAELFGEIVSVPEYPVTLEVEGYPDIRHEKEPYTLVRVSMKCRGLPETPDKPILVLSFYIPLHNLIERPSLATRKLTW